MRSRKGRADLDALQSSIMAIESKRHSAHRAECAAEKSYIKSDYGKPQKREYKTTFGVEEEFSGRKTRVAVKHAIAK